MTGTEFVHVAHAATNLADAAKAAYWVERHSLQSAEFHETDMHREFAKLARALGYRVEKIAPDAEPVLASPADAINAVRADLAELAARVGT